MIRYAWRSLLERKVRTSLAILGVAVCVLTLATVDGMLGSMHAERTQDAVRFVDRLLLQPTGVGYPPFEGVLREESVAATLERSDIVVNESTPLLLVVLEPADNPMDIAGIFGLGVWPGRENAWIGGTEVLSGQATLVGVEIGRASCRERV